ncbi:MAG TPA: FAD-binding oxidoreductase [Gemmatimonadales bacterium]|nr:FAD-binding oxidoreductase [Gemmatimonadales bacterium]
MRTEILARLRALLGNEGASAAADGVPRALPDNVESLAQVCHVAHAEGWKVRVEGEGSWLPPDAPADLAISTRALENVLEVSASDLAATVQGGVRMDVLRRRLAEHELWLPLDPPGRPERTIGSVLATATAGPLRLGQGQPRDYVLGCSVVTGDGRVVRAGGRVMKNVAGYDLTRLQVGGFGAFGIIAEAHLKLRAVPRADATLLARGQRDALTAAARDVMEASVPCAALELFSPTLAADAEWVLAARIMGSDGAVQADVRRLQASAQPGWAPLDAETSSAFWSQTARGVVSMPVTVRFGVLGDGLDELLDLVTRDLNEGLVSAGAGGGLRWSGVATVERLRTLRRLLAEREIPMTLERAPWDVRQQLGHFGAYREGVGQLVSGLRDAFDPGHTLNVALEGGVGA